MGSGGVVLRDGAVLHLSLGAIFVTLMALDLLASLCIGAVLLVARRHHPEVAGQPGELPVVDIVPLPSGKLDSLGEVWPRGRRRALAQLLVSEYADIREVRPLADWPPESVENLIDSETLMCLDATLEGAMKWLELPEEAKCP
jgi:hypothetical protein